jgi:hypothetical protein
MPKTKSAMTIMTALIITLMSASACNDGSSSTRLSSDKDAGPAAAADAAQRIDAHTDATKADALPTANVRTDADRPDAAADAGRTVLMPSYELPPTTALGMRRGYRIARSIIHSHTPFSHDACDGDGQPDGVINEPCLQDYRLGLCANRLDFVFNTDHEELAARFPFEALLLQRPGDELILEDGVPTANRIACENGAQPILLPGGEFEVMPVAMKRHVVGTIEEREAIYNAATVESVNLLRETGAVILQAHGEQRTVEELRPLGLDGFEIYNLHANVAPNLRQEFLGLDPLGFITALGPFLLEGGPPGDLAILGFIEPSPPALRVFDTLVAQGQHLTGTGGSDSHQNVLSIPAGDGERIDSFRRMMRWFSNHLLVSELSPAAARAALVEGRLYIVFEAFGTPSNFDFRAQAGASVIEMGESVSLADGPIIHVTRPGLTDSDVDVPIGIRLIKAEVGGGVEVAVETEGDLVFTPTQPGAYRAEVKIRPEQYRAALGDSADALLSRDVVWIYANPIYVTE